MKLVPRLCLGAWLVFVSIAPALAADRPLLLVDRSGSMKGFDTTGAVAETIQMLRDRIQSNPRVLWVASDEGRVELVPYEKTADYSQETRLFEAVELARRRFPNAPSLWLLTDNVPSHRGEDRDLERFYDWLRGSGNPYQVTLFVLKLPFAGKIYRKDGRSALAENYQGARATVLYATLLDRDEKQQREFARAVDRVGEAFQERRPRQHLRLRCKPLQYDSVAMELVSGSMEKKPDGTLEGRGREGEVFHGTFTIRLRSTMEHVRFSNVRPRFTTSKFFETADFDTRQVRPSLSERNLEEIGKGWTGLEATLTLEPVRLERTFGSSLKALAKGQAPGVIEGYLKLGLEADRRSFVILSEDVGAFSTAGDIFEDPSETVQSRVYRLQELFQEKFVEDQLVLYPAPEIAGAEAGQVPVRILMTYSSTWAFVAVAALVLPLLVVASILLVLWRVWSMRYQLIGEGLSDRPFRIRPSHPVRGPGGIMGTLHQIPPFLWFSAAPGWKVGGSERQGLRREGGTLDVRNKSGQGLRFKVTRAATTTTRNRTTTAKPAASSDPFGRRRF